MDIRSVKEFAKHILDLVYVPRCEWGYDKERECFPEDEDGCKNGATHVVQDGKNKQVGIYCLAHAMQTKMECRPSNRHSVANLPRETLASALRLLAKWILEIPESENFMARALKNRYKDINEAIDLEISAWHNENAPHGELHEWLGMTWEEYQQWAKDPKSIREIIEKRKNDQQAMDV